MVFGVLTHALSFARNARDARDAGFRSHQRPGRLRVLLHVRHPKEAVSSRHLRRRSGGESGFRGSYTCSSDDKDFVLPRRRRRLPDQSRLPSPRTPRTQGGRVGSTVSVSVLREKTRSSAALRRDDATFVPSSRKRTRPRKATPAETEAALPLNKRSTSSAVFEVRRNFREYVCTCAALMFVFSLLRRVVLEKSRSFTTATAARGGEACAVPRVRPGSPALQVRPSLAVPRVPGKFLGTHSPRRVAAFAGTTRSWAWSAS